MQGRVYGVWAWVLAAAVVPGLPQHRHDLLLAVHELQLHAELHDEQSFASPTQWTCHWT